MAKKAPVILDDIKNAAFQAVENFNKTLKGKKYILSFKGKFAYLSRLDERSAEIAVMNVMYKYFKTKPPSQEPIWQETLIARLEWEDNRWLMAPYRYSRERYEKGTEFAYFFPGAELADGTMEGIMKAGLKLYP